MQSIDEINHPYLKSLEGSLTALKFKVECLEKRLALIDDEFKDKSAYQKNEAELIKLMTTREITASKKDILHREDHYIRFMQSHVEELEMIDANYNNVFEEAKNLREEYKKLDDYMNRTNVENIEKDTLAKIKFYRLLRSLIDEYKKQHA